MEIVLFAVLDGRQAHSKGMMLDEFARFLIGMEVVDAVNFDGGGSSELVIGGKIVNSPSDGNGKTSSNSTYSCTPLAC